MIVSSYLIQTPKVVTISKFTGHNLLEYVVTVDQNTKVAIAYVVKYRVTMAIGAFGLR